MAAWTMNGSYFCRIFEVCTSQIFISFRIHSPAWMITGFLTSLKYEIMDIKITDRRYPERNGIYKVIPKSSDITKFLEESDCASIQKQIIDSITKQHDKFIIDILKKYLDCDQLTSVDMKLIKLIYGDGGFGVAFTLMYGGKIVGKMKHEIMDFPSGKMTLKFQYAE